MSKSTITIKFAGGVLIGAAVFFLGAVAAKTFYTTEVAVQGDMEPVRGYAVLPAEGAAQDTAPAEPVPQKSLPELLAAADIANGEKLFSKCKACHKREDGKNGVGPHMYGVYGREIASTAGFKYSDALSSVEGIWSAEALDAWLENPKAFAPGNKMTFKGLSKEGDRADMIAYLATIGGDGLDLNALDGAEAPAQTPAPMQEEPATEAAEAPAADMSPAPEPAAETAEALPEADMAPAMTTEAPAADMAPAPEPAPTAAAEAPAADMVPAPEASPAAEPAPAAEPVAETAAMAGDPAAGEKVFKKCAACHALEEGKNKIGPSLFAVVGREVGATDFKYSDALLALGGVWSAERLDQFLTKPRDMAPGNKMSFAGLRKEEDRANIIAYLATIQ